MSEHFEDKAREYAAINDDKAANLSMSYNKYDIAEAYENGAKFGYELCQQEYEGKLRWIPIEENLPEKASLIILECFGCSDLKRYVIYGFDPITFEGKFYVNGVVSRWRYLFL